MSNTRLDAAFHEFMTAQETGAELDVDELLSRYPDVAVELREAISVHERMTRLPDAMGTPVQPLPEVEGYDVLEELGRGGMGVVYRAVSLSLGREVALKVARESESADLSYRRFMIEVTAAARLEHPNIVPIWEFEDLGARSYFTMPLYRGGSLASEAGEYFEDPRRAIAVVATIARAVHHAHESGVVHRDLKPSNILFDASKEPIVTDFGLAKIPESTELTRSGDIVGSLAYLSPEQAFGASHAAGSPSDIYSLGAILYELLTRRPPFEGTYPEVLAQIRERSPLAPSVLRPQLSRDVDTICLKCLRKNPQRRYLSASDLADDLEAYLDHRPIRARPISLPERAWKWSRRHRGMAAGLLVSCIAVVGLFLLGLVYNARLRELADRERARARDYAHVAYINGIDGAWDALGEENVESARAALGRLVEGTDELDFRSLDWYALRRRCFDSSMEFRFESPVSSVRALEGREPGSPILVVGTGSEVIAFTEDPRAPLWTCKPGAMRLELSADRSRLAVIHAEDVVVVYALTEGWLAPREIARVELRSFSETVVSIRAFAFARSGTAFAVGGRRGRPGMKTHEDPGLVEIWDVGASAPRVSLGWDAYALAFSDDETHLFVGRVTGEIDEVDAGTGARGRTFRASERVTQALAMTSLEGVPLLLSGSQRGDIRAWATESGKNDGINDGQKRAQQRHALVAHRGPIRELIPSPDREHFLSVGGNTVQLWSTATPDTDSPLVLRGGVDALSADFLPDGRGVVHVYGDRRVVVHRFPISAGPFWSPEIEYGDLVRFRNDQELVVMGEFGWIGHYRLENREPFFPELVRETRRHVASWSEWTLDESGARVLVAREASDDAPALALYPLESEEPLATWEAELGKDDGIGGLAFRADGRRAVAAVGGQTHIFDVEGSRLDSIATLPGPFAADYSALSPDGKTLAQSEFDRQPEPDRLRLRFVDLASGRSFEHEGADPLYCLVFSADGARLACAGRARTIQVWTRVESSGDYAWEFRVVGEHADTVSALVFSADQRLLISGGDDRAIKFWDLEKGLERATLAEFRGTVDAVRLSPNGKILATFGGEARRELERGEIWALSAEELPEPRPREP